jgi:DNA-binding CsgD family transcriptional regulator
MPLLLLEGDWDEVERAALAWYSGGSAVITALRALAPLAYHRGDQESAWKWIGEGLSAGIATAPGEGECLDVNVLQRLAAAMAMDAGDLPTARQWLEAHDHRMAWSGAVLGRAEGALAWASHHRAAGEAALAYQRANEALRHATEPRQPLALLATHRLLGELDTDAGRSDAAAEHLQTSLHLADACAAPFERALTLLSLAELHAATGKRSEAEDLLEEVRAICTPLGARPTLERADALIARLASMKATPPAYPAGLSAREVEVLRLVASGLTNAQVADRLFLSPRTINAHLTTIYTKLNVPSRAAAIRFALDHDLR